MAACTQQEFGGGHSESERGKEICRGGSKQRELERERVGVGDMYIYMHT